MRGLSQPPVEKKTVLQKAHERKIDTCDFLPTDKGQFLSKVFSVDDTRTNRTHHLLKFPILMSSTVKSLAERITSKSITWEKAHAMIVWINIKTRVVDLIIT